MFRPFSFRSVIHELNQDAIENEPVPINPWFVYENDFDIVNFDETVKRFLRQQSDKWLPVEQGTVGNLLARREWLVKERRGTLVMLNTLNAKIDEAMMAVKKRANAIKEYGQKARPFLMAYPGLDGEERLSLISDFLEMCQEFYPHQIHRKPVCFDVNNCPVCNVLLDEELSGILRCPQCFRQFTADFYAEEKRTDRTAYFIQAIQRYEGKRKMTLPANAVERVSDFATQRGYLRNNIWTVPINRAFLLALVLATDSRYRDYASLIIHALGLPLPQITNQDELIETFNFFVKEYEPRFGKNLPNIDYLLYKLLEILGAPVLLADFQPFIDYNTLQGYDEKVKAVCQVYNWRFVPTKLSSEYFQVALQTDETL